MRSSPSAQQSDAVASAAASSVEDLPGPSRLQAEIRSRASEPYLLTVTSGCRPHCSTVAVTWDAPDGPPAVRPVPRTWMESEAAGYRQVTLLWPPAEPGGYSLIVDGTAACRQAGNDLELIVTVTRAVLHRRGPASAGSGSAGSGSAGSGSVDSSSACGSDCVPLTG